MSRLPIVAGNWKLNGTLDEAQKLATSIRDAYRRESWKGVEVVLAPVATALHSVASVLRGTPIGLAGQNTHHETSGAFTGELSPTLLKDVGCTHCIVGHSERRTLFGETDEGVNRKAAAAIAAGLVPIICVGESLAQREAGQTLDVVLSQVDAALAGIDLEAVVLAYEPIWAIGTGKTASPDDAQEVHAAIRGQLRESRGEVADGLRILYGGSVKPDNAASLMGQSDIDGALVGGASLKAETFVPIIRAALH